jgi:hypothetical protein
MAERSHFDVFVVPSEVTMALSILNYFYFDIPVSYFPDMVAVDRL